jgi:CRISPR/Cas system-associated endonuclease Cas1
MIVGLQIADWSAQVKALENLAIHKSANLWVRIKTPAAGFNLLMRQVQYRRSDDAVFALDFARQIVTAKIHNQEPASLVVG